MIRRALWRLLLEQGGWSRIWYGLATAMVIAGGGLIYNQTRPPAGACAWPTCFPDATNTGVPTGTTLTAYTGPAIITTPNTVVDSKDITECIGVATTGVVIKNSRLTCDGNGVAGFPGGSPNGAITIWNGGGAYSATFQDMEIICSPHSEGSTGITGDHFTMTRLDIHDCENSASIDDISTVQDSYMHDMYNGGAAHADGLQFGAGASNVNIFHNTIITLGPGGSTGQLAGDINVDVQTEHNWLITHNKLGGAAIELYCPKPGAADNFQIIDNSFMDNSAYGGYSNGECHDEIQSGNIKFEDGSPLTLG